MRAYNKIWNMELDVKEYCNEPPNEKLIVKCPYIAEYKGKKVEVDNDEDWTDYLIEGDITIKRAI